MVYAPPSVFEIGVEIASCLSSGDEPSAMRLAFRFVEVFERASLEDRDRLVRDAPATTGDARYNALLAAVTEYVCARGAIISPAWVDDESRFLAEWWFVSGIISLHADAIAHSPISFARRGVFITAGALSYA
jgi:hypothetical protein